MNASNPYPNNEHTINLLKAFFPLLKGMYLLVLVTFTIFASLEQLLFTHRIMNINKTLFFFLFAVFCGQQVMAQNTIKPGTYIWKNQEVKVESKDEKIKYYHHLEITFKKNNGFNATNKSTYLIKRKGEDKWINPNDVFMGHPTAVGIYKIEDSMLIFEDTTSSFQYVSPLAPAKEDTDSITIKFEVADKKTKDAFPFTVIQLLHSNDTVRVVSDFNGKATARIKKPKEDLLVIISMPIYGVHFKNKIKVAQSSLYRIEVGKGSKLDLTYFSFEIVKATQKKLVLYSVKEKKKYIFKLQE